MKYRSGRKVTPKVRDGRAQKKNRAERSVDADDKLLSKAGITLETRSPGPGRRHVVTELDVQRFLRCIPDWEVHSAGLRAIVLADCDDCLGRYDHRGIIYLASWDKDLFWECERAFFKEHEPTLVRLGVPSDACPEGNIPLYFDESSARAFQLVHIFLHELGHHRDRTSPLTSGAERMSRQRLALRRGEDFAESWALHMEELVWPRYKEFFGVPGRARLGRKPPQEGAPQ